jgi:cell division protein FtsZ
MVFIACGMGGATGSGAGPVVAKIAKEQGILTIAVVTKPFSFEGAQRAKICEAGINNLKSSVDALIIIPNDRILGMVEKDTTFTTAFQMCDEVLKQAVEGISDLITMPGIINVDFADVRTVMQNAGSALMGIGYGSGEKRAELAAKMAINSPLLDVSIEGAKGVLFAISGGEDLTMLEIQEAAGIITEAIDSDARVIFGAIKDERLKKGEVKITVIASGFPEGKGIKKPNIFPFSSSATKPEEKEEKKKEETIIRIEEQPKEQEKKLDEDEWDSVPAFLRRKRL